MTNTFVRTRVAVLALLAKAAAGAQTTLVREWITAIDDTIAGNGTASTKPLADLEAAVKAERTKINRGKAAARATRLGLRSLGIDPKGPYGERLEHTAYNNAVAALGKRIAEILAALQYGRDKAKQKALLDAITALVAAVGSQLPFEEQKALHELIVGLAADIGDTTGLRDPSGPDGQPGSTVWASTMITSSSTSNPPPPPLP